MSSASDPAGASGVLDWRWGTLDDTARDAIDNEVKHFIADTLRGMSTTVAPPDGVKWVSIPPEWLPGMGPSMAPGGVPVFSLRVSKALVDFCDDELQQRGIAVIQDAIATPAQAPEPLPDASLQRADAGAVDATLQGVH